MHFSDEDALSREMRSTLAQGALFAGKKIEITLLRGQSSVGDGCSMYLLDRACVLHLAPLDFPDVAAAADAMRAVLGRHAEIMLDALESGRIGTRSYFVTPLCTPLPGGRLGQAWNRWRTAPLLLGWLEDVVRIPIEADAPFLDQCERSLVALTDEAGLDAPVRVSADKAVHRLWKGDFRPRPVPMHGDLWSGNILRLNGALRIIDWRGSLPHGYAMFDLVRLCQSFGLGPARLRAAIRTHVEALGCAPEDARGYLMAALGPFARHRGEFPLDRFIAMAHACWASLDEAVG